MKTRKTLGIIAVTVFLAATLFAGGCTTKSGSTQQVDRSDWEWVPSVWVVDSFGNQNSRCSFDEASNGYYCPPGTH